MNDHILRHYGRLQPRADAEPYAIAPSRHSAVTPRPPSSGGEGLVLPPLSPEARALLLAWAEAQNPAPPPAPPVGTPPRVESTFWRNLRLRREREE